MVPYENLCALPSHKVWLCPWCRGRTNQRFSNHSFGAHGATTLLVTGPDLIYSKYTYSHYFYSFYSVSAIENMLSFMSLMGIMYVLKALPPF